MAIGRNRRVESEGSCSDHPALVGVQLAKIGAQERIGQAGCSHGDESVNDGMDWEKRTARFSS